MPISFPGNSSVVLVLLLWSFIMTGNLTAVISGSALRDSCCCRLVFVPLAGQAQGMDRDRWHRATYDRFAFANRDASPGDPLWLRSGFGALIWALRHVLLCFVHCCHCMVALFWLSRWSSPPLPLGACFPFPLSWFCGLCSLRKKTEAFFFALFLWILWLRLQSLPFREMEENLPGCESSPVRAFLNVDRSSHHLGRTHLEADNSECQLELEVLVINTRLHV